MARILAMSEYYVMSDSKIMKKISRIGKKSMKQMDADVEKILKNIPLKQQEAEYEKLSNDSTKIFSNFDKVFVKNRKKGRTPKKRLVVNLKTREENNQKNVIIYSCCL